MDAQIKIFMLLPRLDFLLSLTLTDSRYPLSIFTTFFSFLEPAWVDVAGGARTVLLFFFFLLARHMEERS